MINKTKTLIALLSIPVAGFSGAALAVVPLGEPLGIALPFGDGGLIGLAAAGVVGVVWLARRNQK